ncbi:MAG: PKD domain-containing protein [Candidatus Omnitrophota bacterium]|nr:PKD domain-containing protein [Candidatus Omnitrophota bacterium]
MKIKLLLVISALLFLSGCATYSLKKGEYSPYNKGFIVTRYDRVIPEYTLGKDNSIPIDEQVARQRFQRRRKEVENYYKKMGYIENRFKQNFIDPPVFIVRSVIGVFRLPAIMISDYQYNHDPKYKERIDKLEDAEYKVEKERIKALKDRLNAYIQEDLKKEGVQASTEEKPQAPATVTEKVTLPPETKEPVKKEAVETVPPKEQLVSPAASKDNSHPAVQASAPVSVKEKIVIKSQASTKAPIAVIITKPQKGPSPLFVQFNGSQSSSPNGKIVSYSWEFGDGDTSTKRNPTNTYWSSTYGSRKYTATLTVKDNKGVSAVTSTEIEVITK